eukprot:gene18809-25353_t
MPSSMPPLDMNKPQATALLTTTDMATKAIRFLKRQYGHVEFSSFQAMYSTVIGMEEGRTAYLVRCQEMYSQIPTGADALMQYAQVASLHESCISGVPSPFDMAADAPSNSATNGYKSPSRRKSGSRSPPKDRFGKKTGIDRRRYKNKPRGRHAIVADVDI